MLWILQARKTGKTTAMLEWASHSPKGEARVIVTPTKEEAMSLLRRSRNEGYTLSSWQFISVEEARRPSHAAIEPGRVVLGLDDVDRMLQRMFHFPVVRATASSDE
jgi:hypothetical protein